VSTALFLRLRELTAGPPLLVGEVVTINGDGTSTITLPTGGEIRARGTSVSVGNNAFVRNGVIEGAAPSLSTVTIEI
jgi:hypothetical protein